MQQRVTLERQENHAVDVLLLAGELDLANAREVEDALLEEVGERSPGLVADLTSLQYVDSAGIRLFVEISERLRRNRQAFALAVPEDAPISRTLSIVKLELLVPIHPTIEAAAEDVAASASTL
jgi:anti-sigma B factor antagonist